MHGQGAERLSGKSHQTLIVNCDHCWNMALPYHGRRDKGRCSRYFGTRLHQPALMAAASNWAGVGRQCASTTRRLSMRMSISVAIRLRSAGNIRPMTARRGPGRSNVIWLQDDLARSGLPDGY